MSQAISVSSNRPYGLRLVCRVWRIAASTVYARRKARTGASSDAATTKRGPRVAISDDDLILQVREVLAASPWVGEGHRKVHAYIKARGHVVGRTRVLAAMRNEGLLAPQRLGRAHGPKAHDGTIVPERPNQLWGADATSTWTDEGNATIFLVVDHACGDLLGVHAARCGTRFEAIETLKQAVLRVGEYSEDFFRDLELALRHDWGSQFVSKAFQAELRFLGIRSTPSFVREPQGNGCVERMVRTLKEQLLWLRRFATIDELNVALQDFLRLYNERWILERHGYLTPAQFRRKMSEAAVVAA